MRVKSYYASAVEDAMAQARQELGEDAMLVRTRRSLAEARHLGEYEVIFASDLETGEQTGSAAPAAGGGPDRLSAEIADLKRELEGMRRTLARSAFEPARRLGASVDAAGAYTALVSADVHPELARDLVDAAEQRPARRVVAGQPVPGEAGTFGEALAAEIEARIKTLPELGRNGGTPRIVALIGPPGAGKTTTLVKLAVNYGLACRRPALLLSMDTYRIAAADQLRTYALILGIGCQVQATSAALAQAIEENRSKDVILIDTPGLGRPDMDEGVGLARMLATRSDIDTHLVLPASMKPADLVRTVNAYEIFGPQKLLFTKLDETGSFGPILNEAARTGKALSFFATGQRVPEDLEAATRRKVVELVLAGGASGQMSEGRTAA